MTITVALDVDGVVADLHSAWLARYNREWKDSLRVEDILGWDMKKFCKPESGNSIYQYGLEPNLYDAVEPILGALESIQHIRQSGHRIFFVTSTPNSVAGRKLRWLVEWGFLTGKFREEPDYIECGSDKSFILADMFVDDNPVNIQAFKGKYGIVFDRPWNGDFDWKYRAAGWSQVVEFADHIAVILGDKNV